MSYHILVVDDDAFQCKTTQLTIEKLLRYQVSTSNSGNEALNILLSERGSEIDLVILDLNMADVSGFDVLEKIRSHKPELPVIINTAYGDVKKAVDAVKKGAIDFIEKQDGPERLKVSIENVRLMSTMNLHLRKLDKFQSGRYEFDDIIGGSSIINKTKNSAKKAAQSNIPVLIHGESGVGKELFARAIHNYSERSSKPMIAVNCGAIPDNLVESVLFGHEKGAFTGAVERSLGKFREAEGGTIFLDEIAELPLETQAKLLRVLQSFEVEPIGASRSVPVNVRVISATNKNLEKAVLEGRFREDLFYRLNVMQIEVPSLRQRRDDIPLLVDHFIEKICVKERKKILTADETLINLLKDYWWPGNIRQLENAIYRAVILCDSERLTMDDFENILSAIGIGHIKHDPQEAPDKVGYASHSQAKFKTISEHESDIISKALEYYNYNISKVSKILHIGRSTLYRKMKEYNIEMKGSVEEMEEFKQTRA